MKIPFSIKYKPQIESGEYKVFTDAGEPVEIVKWDCKGECPVLAVIDDGDTHDSCFFNEYGKSSHGTDSLYVDNGADLTEFEEALKESMLYDVRFVPTNDDVKRQANKLLNIVRKEVLKDLPKWKLNLSEVSHLPDDYSIVYDFESGKDYSCATRMLECGNYRISISELLDKLPKEE